MDLRRLLHPRTVAVVGATDREGSYAGETLLNLAAAGFPGKVGGVNPGRDEVYGRPCFPALSDLPEAPGAVVVAIPAPGVPAVVEEAGALRCGGAVVFGAGFGEMAAGADALGGAAHGDRSRGADHEYLEAEGDGERLCEALARCAEEGVGIAVLKAGSSAAGSAAAAAHTGAVAGDQRVLRALVEEAGAAWAADPHELLELGKALAVPGARRPRGAGGLAVLTCSGGDSALAADEAERLELPLAELEARTVGRLRDVVPAAATVANPLDYTALIWGQSEALRDIVAAVGDDAGVAQLLVVYDQPADIA